LGKKLEPPSEGEICVERRIQEYFQITKAGKMKDSSNKIKEVGRKKGDVLERFTKLQRTVMPLSRRIRRKEKVEKFRTVQELNDAGVH
jgi:hypothetical protein